MKIAITPKPVIILIFIIFVMGQLSKIEEKNTMTSKMSDEENMSANFDLIAISHIYVG